MTVEEKYRNRQPLTDADVGELADTVGLQKILLDRDEAKRAAQPDPEYDAAIAPVVAEWNTVFGKVKTDDR